LRGIWLKLGQFGTNNFHGMTPHTTKKIRLV
jgi:hypothetical protein